MRSLSITISAALISASLTAPVAAAPLQPVENWGLDYGDTQCTAARSFGSASAPTILGIVPSFSGNSYVLMVSVPKQGPDFAKQVAGTVDFGQGPVASTALYYGKHGVNQSVYQYRLSAAEMARARNATALAVTAGRDAYAFTVSDMPGLFDNLAKCTASLQQYWNASGQGTKTFARSALADLKTLFTNKNYPTEAAAMRQHGEAQYQLLIDERGAVQGCDILKSSGVPTLDATGCEVIKEQAKFMPAMSADGRAVRSVMTTQPLGWGGSGIAAFDNGCNWVNSAVSNVNACGQQQSESYRVLPAPRSN